MKEIFRKETKLTLFSRQWSRPVTELTRQITPPTNNGHAPPPIESGKELSICQSLQCQKPGEFSASSSSSSSAQSFSTTASVSGLFPILRSTSFPLYPGHIGELEFVPLQLHRSPFVDTSVPKLPGSVIATTCSATMRGRVTRRCASTLRITVGRRCTCLSG